MANEQLAGVLMVANFVWEVRREQESVGDPAGSAIRDQNQYCG
jgi:hypothetical protein